MFSMPVLAQAVGATAHNVVASPVFHHCQSFNSGTAGQGFASHCSHHMSQSQSSLQSQIGATVHRPFFMHHQKMSDSNNAFVGSFHHHNFNNQLAIALVGRLNANGSLEGAVSLPKAFGLDLSSNQSIMSAGIVQPVTILVGGRLDVNGNIFGGTPKIIMPGQMVTAAQYVAMEQAVSGHQTLVLTSSGTAISGVITLVAGQVNTLSSVQVPSHVLLDTVGFTSNNPLSVTGATQIFGSFYALQQTANASAVLDSGSLFIGGRGTISNSLTNSQSLFNSIFSSNGMTLSVLGNVTNQGMISSIGTLSIQSGGQIANLNTPTHQALITAPNVNLYSASGIVINSGRVVASKGNVQLDAPVRQNVSINNTGGTIQALQGAINIRDTAYTGMSNTALTGGDWLSQKVNLNSGTGIATANIGNVTGTINTNAGEEHIIASTANLILGNAVISGDPSYFNTSGAVTIAGNLNFSGQDLAIVAKTNIVTAAGAGAINTGSNTGNGGNIIMIAGANFTTSGPASGSNDTTTTLTVNSGTSAGGYIDLSGSISGSGKAISSLTTASSFPGGNGGNLTLVAYGGSGPSAGRVNLPIAVTIATGGSGVGKNGVVNIISGATSNTGISIGGINTTGGIGGGGNINLATQTPTISGAPNMTILNGSITNGATYIGGTTNASSITVGALSSSGGTITIRAGGAVNSGAITNNGSGAGHSAGNVTISAANGVNVGIINASGLSGASGGSVSILSTGQAIVDTLINAEGSGAGNGGSVTTSSATLVSNSKNSIGNSIDVSASGTGTGGTVSITTTAAQAFTVGNGAGTENGTAGNISANGHNGGFVSLINFGNSTNGIPNQIINGKVTANGTTGTGGKILLQGQQPAGSAPLITQFNGGIIQASNNSNNSGLIGFNGGAGQNVSLLGTGIVNAGTVVRVGNLNTSTLALLSVRAGTIFISPTVIITNALETNGTFSVPPPPAIPPSIVVTPIRPLLVAETPALATGLDLSKTDTDITPVLGYVNLNGKGKRRYRLAGGHRISSIAGAKSYLHSFTAAEISRLTNDGMSLNKTSADNYLSVDRGNILLSPDKKIIVGTHEGNVYLSRGAIAFVMESGHDVIVYDLRQSQPRQVSIIVNKHKLFLHPGNMLVLTKQHIEDFEDIDADCHRISYRRVQAVPISGRELKAFIAEYSIASAMLVVEPLKQLIVSSNKEDSNVLHKIIKGAVMLNDFTGTIDMEQLANLDQVASTREIVLDRAGRVANTNAQMH